MSILTLLTPVPSNLQSDGLFVDQCAVSVTACGLNGYAPEMQNGYPPRIHLSIRFYFLTFNF